MQAKIFDEGFLWIPNLSGPIADRREGLSWLTEGWIDGAPSTSEPRYSPRYSPGAGSTARRAGSPGGVGDRAAALTRARGAGHPRLGWEDTLCYLTIPAILVCTQTLSLYLLGRRATLPPRRVSPPRDPAALT